MPPSSTPEAKPNSNDYLARIGDLTITKEQLDNLQKQFDTFDSDKQQQLLEALRSNKDKLAGKITDQNLSALETRQKKVEQAASISTTSTAIETVSPAPEAKIDTRKLPEQIKENTDLITEPHEITINGEKIKFQITEKGLILNDHIYTANIKAPGHWSAKDETLYPKITKAIWGENGIDVEEEITFTKKDGETSINKKKATIKFDEIPAFFDQAKTGKSFVFKYNFLLFLHKDINFEKVEPTTK